MARTRTLLVDIRKLQRQGAEGATVLRLMMACNDLTTANQALGASREDTCEKTAYIRRGAAMYFVRLQMAHLHEALKVVREIQGFQRLRNLVDDCPGDAADLFAQLLSFAGGSAQHDDFLKVSVRATHLVPRRRW
jgi:hypothetical protein